MAAKKWSAEVTDNGDALALETNDCESDDPKHIAQSLKSSAEHSKRHKGTSYQSAMSMLTFYINRAGKNQPDARRKILEPAKGELRGLFERTSFRIGSPYQVQTLKLARTGIAVR
jgi:hypothetical protein